MKLLFAFGLCALPASASFPNGYSYCKIVTTSHAMVSGISDLVNYPLTVSLTDPDLKTTVNGGLVNNASGHDIGFGPDCSGSGALLKWELESYAPATGSIIAHVLRPTLSHTSDDSIGMYYGGAFSTFQSTPSAVWDTNYKGIWHFGDGGNLSIADSSANGKNGTTHGSPAAAAGQVDGGLGLASGSSQYITTASLSASALTNFTVSGWIKPNGTQSAGAAILSQVFTSNINYALFFDDQGGTASLNLTGGYYNGAWRRVTAVTIPNNAWTYAVLTYDGTTVKLFINNNAPITTTITSAPASDGNGVNIGKRWDTANFVNGVIDEVRLSGIARSSDWILTEYRNQSAPATYLSEGPLQTGPSSGGYSYCKIVTTQHAMVSGASDLINYPLTVALTDTDLKTAANGGLVNNANGYDIGFGPDCSGSGATLKWEVESYNPATGSIIAHVLRPTLSHTSDDSIGMYYGGAFTAFQSTASAVWDTYYKGVWHLESLAVNDSTGNDNGTNNGGTLTTGKIGSAVAFSGNTYIDLNNPVNLAPPFTLEVWINITAPKTFARVLGNLTSTNYSGYELYLGVNGDTKANFQIGNAGNLGLTRSSVDLGTGWHHLAATLTGTTMTLYVDGVAPTQTQSPTGSGIANSSASLNIGRWSGGASNYFDDPVDEVRLSGGISRSPDWILTEYRNQSSPATYITAGPRISSSSRIRHRVIGGM